MKRKFFHRFIKVFLPAIVLVLGAVILGRSFLPGGRYSTLSALPTASWTVMVYLNGDNELEKAAIDDFLEMAAVGSTAGVNVVVQFDRIGVYDSSYDNWSSSKRFYVTQNMKPTANNAVMDLGEMNMARSSTLVDFIVWAKSHYPARNYALVLWGRGQGWRKSKEALWHEKQSGQKEELRFKSMGWDDSSSRDCLYLSEIKNALKRSGGTQLIGFDAGLMAMVEVAFQVKDYGQVMVASESTVPLDGWPYQTILSGLEAAPSMNPSELGTAIVDRFHQANGERASLSAIDLTRLGSLAGAIDSLARKMINYWNSNETIVRDAARIVMTETERALIAVTAGDYWHWPNGLDIYFPAKLYLFNTDYNGTIIDFPARTAWDEFLQKFYESMTGSWIGRSRGLSGERIDLYSFCQALTRVPGHYYKEKSVEQAYIGVGIAQDFHDDDYCFGYSLPFPFPFFDKTIYEPIVIHSNGYISLGRDAYCYYWPYDIDYQNSSAGLFNGTMIAPCWTDLITYGSAQPGEDVYITENADHVIIRWVAETYGEGEPVDFEAVLFKDGRIQFNYGNGNTDISPWGTPPTIGISKGDGVNGYLSVLDGQSHLTDVESVLFIPACKQSITVTQPLAGETIAAGKGLHIGWTTACPYSDPFRLTLWKADNSAGILIAAAAPWCGYYYDIPPDTVPGRYYIQVKQDNATARSGIFNIASSQDPAQIVVTSPDSCTFTNGDIMTVAWTTSGIFSGTVDIELHLSNSIYPYANLGSVPFNSSPQNYVISCFTHSGTYYIRVIQNETSGKSANFTINQIHPCFYVYYVYSSGTYYPGTELSFNWDYRGYSGNIRISIHKVDESVVYQVADSVPITRRDYYYRIPDTIRSGTYYIRVEQGSTTLGDSSPFTIAYYGDKREGE